jgi:glucosamine--fructose-6-phosphate aminotransferase (isomerizing)
MKSLGKFPDRFLEEIAGQPDAILRAAAAASEQADAIAAIARAATGADSIVFTGMGSSNFACYAPVTTLAQAGVHTTMIDAAELLHFRLPALSERTLLICVSQSGESAEPVRVLEALRPLDRRPTIATVTNGLGNTMAGLADVALDTHAGEELGPSTMTFDATLVLLRELAVALGAPGGDAEVYDRAAAVVGGLVNDAESDATALGAWLGDRPALAIMARGHGRPAAEMGALTLKEAARFPAESLQTAQFRHGPLELAGPHLGAVVIAVEPATCSMDLALAAELVDAGAAVMTVTADGDAPDGAHAVAIGAVDDDLASAAAIVPLQLLSWRLANLRGLEPGSYSVARKVTTRE